MVSNVERSSGTAVTVVCTADGCDVHRVMRCEYRGRDGGRCETLWCRAHIVPYGGHGYCRRHAGTVRALPAGTPLEGTLPPADNRSLALLRWCGDTLDPLVLRLLDHVQPQAALIRDPARLISDDGGHRWRRGWSAVTLEAEEPVDPVQVELEVHETTDDMLHVVVNGVEIGAYRPPWTDHETSITDDAELLVRRSFYEGVLSVIHGALPSR